MKVGLSATKPDKAWSSSTQPCIASTKCKVAQVRTNSDLPFHPRIQRRRRGPEFSANFKRALLPALQGRVDCVVHGGDLL